MFLTSKAEMMQTDKPGIWQTQHNQLYWDCDGQIYLVPRNYLTDGYTIPLWLSWLGGGKMQWDIRCAIQHDFECQYHQELVVNLSLTELCTRKILKNHITPENKVIVICKDIPFEFIEIRDTTFKNVNDKFQRMMKATNSIKPWRINLMRFAVNFNIGWLSKCKKSINITKIYQTNLSV